MYFTSEVNSQLIQALAHVCHVRQKAYKVSAQVMLWSYVGKKLEIRKIVTNITKKECAKKYHPFPFICIVLEKGFSFLLVIFYRITFFS